MKPFILFITFCLNVSQSFGQSSTLSGKIIDAEDQTAIAGANLVLKSITDSSIKLFASSRLSGTFVFNNVIKGRYVLKIKCPGYTSQQITVSVQKDTVILDTIKMVTDSAASLNEVVIEGHAPPVQQHGDTIQYNADAFHTNPDADLEDLLQKLPGIILENGTITAQGESILQILLDGKPYFGGDLNAALKNIPAETIDKIQVYYKKSEQSKFTGFDDGKSIKIINIITKKDKRDGQFGKAYAGYGNPGQYRGDANLNFFNGNRRISLTGTTGNNISAASGGISKTESLGGNYGDSIGKKSYLSGSYTWYRMDNQTQSNLARTYYGTGTSGSTYTESNASANTGSNHRVSLNWECNPDTINRITFSPSFVINASGGGSELAALNSAGNIPLSRTDNRSTYTNGGMSFSGNLMYGHRFNKPGRTLSFNLTGTGNTSTSAAALNAMNIYYGNTDSAIYNRQHSDMYAITSAYAPSLAYTETLNKNSRLQLNYSLISNSGLSQKQTWNYDSLQKDYQDLDTALSSHFATQTFTSLAGLAYSYQHKKFNLNIGMRYQYLLLTGAQEAPRPMSIRKPFQALLPSAYLNYKLNTKTNLYFTYQTATGMPSVFELENVVNNTNPLQVSAGNPDLGQSYTQTFGSRLGFPLTTGSALMVNAALSQTQHLITSATSIAGNDSLINDGYLLQKGARLTHPVNLDGAWNAQIIAALSVHPSALKMNININAGYIYTAAPGLVNTMPGLTNTSAINTSLVLGSNLKEGLDFTLSYSPAYSLVQNSTQPLLNHNYFNQNVSFRLNWTIWKGIVLNTDFNFHNYSGLGSGYRQNYAMWNASLGKKFFKKQNGELRIYVYDILNQGTSLSHTVTDLYIQDRQTNISTRYFMVSALFHLREYK